MPSCNNYIPDTKMILEVVYPRTDIIVAGTSKFADMHNIAFSVDSDVYHQKLSHRKRSRNEILDNIQFIISKDAFKNPYDTNSKLIGILQNILKVLEPDLKFDMDLMGAVTDALHEICFHSYEMGISSYYASQQRRHLGTLFSYKNLSENIHLNIYYSYNHQEDMNDD